jgi:hypothetical protein
VKEVVMAALGIIIVCLVIAFIVAPVPTIAILGALFVLLAALVAVRSLQDRAYRRRAEPAVQAILAALRREFEQPAIPIRSIEVVWMYGWPEFAVYWAADAHPTEDSDLGDRIRRRFAQLVAAHETSLRRGSATFNPRYLSIVEGRPVFLSSK